MSEPTVQIQTQANAAFMDRVRTLRGRAQDRLSSGTKWASASDDPVGLGLVEKMAAQSKRLDAAQINAQNAISLTQATDGFLTAMGNLLTRMSELAQFAHDPSKNSSDNALYQTEFSQLQEQLRNTIGGSAVEIGGSGVSRPLGTFNGNVLFKANPAGMTIMIGKDSSDTMAIGEMNLRTGAMASVISQDSSGNFLMRVDDAGGVGTLVSAMDQISSARSTIGASRGRLDLATARISQEGQELENNISKLRDTDIATETTQLSKFDILAETSTAMLAQAAAAPQAILQLLRGA